MKMAWLKKRQTQYGFYVAAYLLVVVGILGAANYLANRYNKSFDATGSRIFSLSDQTKKIIRNLKTDATIYYFDQPTRTGDSRFGPSPRDLLSRYSDLSHRVKVEYVDPVRNPKKTLDMKVTATGTTIVEVNGRREEAKSLNEEQVTNALIRALKPNKRTACFLTGHGEHDLEASDGGGFSEVKQSLESGNFLTKSISLMEKQAAVPSECTVLVVAGPRNELLDVEIEAIRKYVEGSGRALFLLDPPTKNVSANNLVKMLAGWGVEVNQDIVLDVSGIGQLFGANELSPLVTRYESHPITREMRNVASLFPLARSVEPLTPSDKIPAETRTKVSVEKLFSTSSRSYASTDFASGEVKLDPKKDKQGPLALAVAGTYRGDKAGSQGRFVVAGSSRFVTNSTLSFPGGNRDLFLNMMSWLSSDEDLISIRPKEPEDRRLTLSAAQMRRLLYASVFGYPLLIVACGAFVWWRRR